MPSKVGNDPLISVIIPTYNRPDYLRRAIGSVLNQTYDNVELIVIDDASNYDVRGLVNAICSDIEVVVNSENLGANRSRMRGIKRSDGRYVAFLDDDDFWKQTKLEKQLRIMENFEEVGIVSTGLSYIDNGYKIPAQVSGNELTKRLLLGDNPLSSFSAVMVRSAVIEAAGMPDPELESSQDLEWYIRLSGVAESYIIQEPLVLRDVDDSRDRITANKIDNVDKEDSMGYILDKHNNCINYYGQIFKHRVYSNYFCRKGLYLMWGGRRRRAFYFLFWSILYFPLNLKAYWSVLLTLIGPRVLTFASNYK